MTKGKGYTCPECGKAVGKHEKGAFHCPSCKTVWWGAFDRPSAGQPRKGYKCKSCGNQTVHPLATVASAKIWRCSVCASTIVKPTEPAADD